MYPETLVGGAPETLSTGQTKKQCLGQCTGQSGCEAFNWNEDTLECFIFTAGVPAVGVPGNNQEFYHFRKCDASPPALIQDAPSKYGHVRLDKGTQA